MSGQEFKDFLQKNFRDSKAFIDDIWSKVKKDSWNQDKSVQDWAMHLEYIYFILIEFDPNCALKKGTIIKYFREGLWS